MTAATLAFDRGRSEPAVAICAGRALLLSGLAFGSAHLVQWAIVGGALDVHPAMLGVNWALAVGAFLIGLARLRRSGGEGSRRVARWSRAFVLAHLGAALSLAAVSALTADWSLMRWSAVAGLGFYAFGWAVAAIRTGTPNMASLFAISLAGAVAAALLTGSPDQSLIHAATLTLVSLLPGLWLAFGRRL